MLTKKFHPQQNFCPQQNFYHQQQHFHPKQIFPTGPIYIQQGKLPPRLFRTNQQMVGNKRPPTSVFKTNHDRFKNLSKPSPVSGVSTIPSRQIYQASTSGNYVPNLQNRKRMQPISEKLYIKHNSNNQDYFDYND